LTKTKGCGENRFVGIKNFLEFYIDTGCEITVEPLDQIKTSVRLSWTLEEFYAEGGTTTFTDRVAASLGIPAWRVKTVAVYEGSVIVDFFILPDESEEDSEAELATIGERLASQLEENTIWFGAPIIDVVTGRDREESDNTPEDNGTDFITENTGTSTLITDFLNDRDNNDQITEPDDQIDEGTDDTTDAS